MGTGSGLGSEVVQARQGAEPGGRQSRAGAEPGRGRGLLPGEVEPHHHLSELEVRLGQLLNEGVCGS